MSDGWFVDTNVAVYVFDDASPDKQRAARALFSGDDAHRIVLSTQVLAEFFVTVTRKLGLSVADAGTAVETLAEFPVRAVDRGLVLAAIATAGANQLSYWDALIIETAASGGCTRVLTEDLTAGQVVSGVQIVNPFVDAK